MTAASGRSARKAWKRLFPSLKVPLQQADAAFVIISVGGLEVLELIPRSLPLYALQPRGPLGFLEILTVCPEQPRVSLWSS